MNNNAQSHVISAGQGPKRTKLWAQLLSCAAVIALGFAGLAVMAAGAAAAPNDEKKVAFCHASASASNPYVSVETSVNAFFNSGHIDHVGPIYPATNPNGSWGDIYPPNDYNLAGQNWTVEGQAVFNNGCAIPGKVSMAPAVPIVVQAVCSAPGVATLPALQLPANTAAISYSYQGAIAAGSTVTVVATPSVGTVLLAGNGWVVDAATGLGLYTVVLTVPDCTIQPTIVTALPVAPMVVQAVCDQFGQLSIPYVTPASTSGIVYTVQGVAANGATVVVTAAPGRDTQLGAAPGWTPNAGIGTATFTVVLETVVCPSSQATTAPPSTTPATTATTTPATTPATTATTSATTPATTPATTVATIAATTPVPTPATTMATTPSTTPATTVATTPATSPAPTATTEPATTRVTTPAKTMTNKVAKAQGGLAYTGLVVVPTFAVAIMFLGIGGLALWRNRRVVGRH